MKEQEKKLKRNLVYQTIYQILTTITPLITSPYISRVLGAKSLGVFSYTNANASYFAMFAILGLANYGCRIIAQHKDDIEKRNKIFSELFAMQILTGFIAFVFYGFYLLLFTKDNIAVAILQGMWILASWLDFSWFFFGIEEFQLTVKRNIIIKVITVILIITCVKRNDTGLIVYTMIMAGGQFISSIALIPFLRRFVKLKNTNWNAIKKHLKPNAVLFVPILASSVFHIMDKTMLGALSGYSELGYYYNSDKLINIPIGIITGFSTVMMPRLSNLNANHENVKRNKTLRFSYELNTFSSVALAFGIAAIANEFVPLFFGEGYDECVNLVYLFSPILIVKGLSIFLRMQYLIPMEREKGYIVAMSLGAVSNLCANFILIPKFGAEGAVVGTFIAEFVAAIVEYFYCRDCFEFKHSILVTLKYIAFGCAMFWAVRLIGKIELNIIVKLCLEVITGIVAFCIPSFLVLFFNRKRAREASRDQTP